MSARAGTRKKEPDFVRTRTEFVRGRNVRRYFAVYGSREVRITKRQFSAYYRRADTRALERKLGRDSKNKHAKTPGAGHCWPMHCEALAVNPRQVERINARNKKHGVNVEYHPKTGLAIIPDEAAYKRLRKLERVHHNNCYDF